MGNRETRCRTGCCLRLDGLPISNVQAHLSGGGATSPSNFLDQSNRVRFHSAEGWIMTSAQQLSRFPSRCCGILQQVRRYDLEHRCQRLHHVESCIAAPSFCAAEIGPSTTGKTSQLLLRQSAFATQSLQVQTKCITKVHRGNLPNVH